MFHKRLLHVSAVAVALALSVLVPALNMTIPISRSTQMPTAVEYGLSPSWGIAFAAADELKDRRKAQEKRSQKAKKELEEAHSAMEGVDKKLAESYIKQKELEVKIPEAVSEVEDANVVLATAKRKEQSVAARLESAQQQLAHLQTSISNDGQQLSETKKTIGELVRRSYRGEAGASTMTLVLTNKTVKDISQLAAAADTAAALQERLSSRLESALAENIAKQNRQEALTASVSELRQQAASAVTEYKGALAKKQEKAQSLLALNKENEELKQRLNQQRAEFEKSEQEAQAAIKAANETMAQIDREIAKREAEARARARAARKVYLPDTLPSIGSGVWGKPIAHSLTVVSPWGYRFHPILGYRRLHEGVDIRSAAGEKQYATHDGVVRVSALIAGCGNMVTIDHGSFGGHRWMTRHCHLSARLVQAGQSVHKGDVIGLTGATGRVTGPHVHFEIWRDGQSINPAPYLGL